MTREKAVLWELFKSTFRISMFTFGGGYVIVPMMQKRFCDELGWIERDEMLDLVAIAQSAPGPIAMNASIMVGYRVAGLYGALVTALGTMFPPLIIMTIVTYIYNAIRDNAYVGYVMLGMEAGIAAIILNVVFDMVAGIIKQGNIVNIIVLLLSLLLAIFYQVNVVWLLLMAAVIGFIQTFIRIQRGEIE